MEKMGRIGVGGMAMLGAGMLAVHAVEPIENTQPSLAAAFYVIPDAHGVGVVTMTASDRPFSGSLRADGATVGVAAHPSLHDAVGSTYGAVGPGEFVLPNLAGTTPIGRGAGPGLTPRTLGEATGSNTVTLGVPNLPVEAGGDGQAFSKMQPSLTMTYGIVIGGGHFPLAGSGTISDYAPGSIETPFLGQIVLTAASDLPNSPSPSAPVIVPAEGQILSIATNNALFSLLGNEYGGNGTTTFALPDLRGRTVMGASDANPLGTTLGGETTTLALENVPSPDGTDAPFSTLQPTMALNYLICAQGAYPSEGDVLGQSQTFLGQIITVPFGFTMPGWLVCDGSLLPIHPNASLYAAIGTSYGGDGATTFALPDFRNRVAVGSSDSMPLGTAFGSNAVTLQENHIPVVVPEPAGVAAGIAALLVVAAVMRRRKRTS